MNGEVQKNLYGILLKYLNQGKKTFDTVEIAPKSDDAAFVFEDLIKQMAEDKILKKIGEDRYRIIVDIGEFRSYILKQTETDRGTDGEIRKTPIDKIINSSWTAVMPNAHAAHDYISFDGDSDGSGDFYANGKFYKSKMEYLEERRRELIRRMEEDIDDEDDEDDEDDDEDDDTDEDDDFGSDDNMDAGEICRQALKFCIERGVASVSLLQRRFPIGYIKACKIIDWMEDQGFISSQRRSEPRRVLIDRNGYEVIFGVPFDGNEGERKESERDRALRRFLKRRASEQVRKYAAQSLVNALSRLAEKKNAPITQNNVPDCSLWEDEQFEEAVLERVERIIKSDRRMGRQGAIKKAETYLDAVRDTHDRKMVQVYERIVYEFKTASDYIYRQLKKLIFDEGE